MILLSVSQCKATLIIVIIAIIGLLVNNGTLDMSFQRHGISANRSTSSNAQQEISSRDATLSKSSETDEPNDQTISEQPHNDHSCSHYYTLSGFNYWSLGNENQYEQRNSAKK